MKIDFNFLSAGLKNGGGYKDDATSTDSSHNIPASVSLELYNKIGADGASAYEVAVFNGFTGTEQEWLEGLKEPALEAAETAYSAANKIEDAISGFEKELASKVSLDNSGTYINAEYVNPLSSVQNGITTVSGYFSINDQRLTGNETKTVEILFTTSEVDAPQTLLSTGTTSNIGVSIQNGIISINAGIRIITSEILEDTTYQCIIAHQQGETNIYLNGWNIGSGRGLPEESGLLTVGNEKDNQSAFKGVIHSLRFFSSVFKKEEVSWIWNNGTPAITLPTINQDINAHRIAEYLPSSLTDSCWRDISGNSNDLMVIGNPGISTVAPQNRHEITRASGRFYNNISSSTHDIPLSKGYLLTGLLVRNYNIFSLTKFSASTYESQTQIIAPMEIYPVADGYQYLWSGGIFPCHEDDHICINATGNGTNGGIEVVTYYRWVGPA